MVSERDVSAAIGSTAYGSDGEPVGTVETFYDDDRTGAPSWVSIASGLLGTRRALAPAGDATFADGRLQLGVPADAVSRAPRLGGEHLSLEEEAELRAHYARALAESTGADGAEPDDEAPRPDEGGMVRVEEQLRVGTERTAARRVRVVKYVITEEVQVTVPIRREEIRIEELPLDAGGDDELVTEGESLDGGAPDGGRTAPAGLPDELVLHAERPVVGVEVVPVERVRLRTELVEGQETVSGTVQRERIAVDEERTPRAGR
ncbi:DUF2382 domain-containing protein [Blastococcus sp. TML/M2B]|uniref:DUF2382 domain-containing protein n=1 Tax=unclassified Blastococcus TaxID=2619396 RepID=UPI00190AFBA7|nr:MULTISPECIES: DUF2382 domain-containing protein [unclassified Blastococcus]MBN1094438.1 DUF2382 domain-containing protein [Blastococcus sp. TML/M2B]MBN1095397.1 DUF2382 domain-containing protein [Blastococcus sp. TML/C7B]